MIDLTAGEMDENVHFSLSMKVANELIKENKDFDMLIVPNTDHSGACILFTPAMPSSSCCRVPARTLARADHICSRTPPAPLFCVR
jgi:hypothetical protein|eukprot:COSAG02_NODE_213_length_28704_cov_69.390177_18_plen_86_part_00